MNSRVFGRLGVAWLAVLPAACSLAPHYEVPTTAEVAAWKEAGDWQPGVYDVAVTTDAGTLRCHVTMSAPGPFNPPARCATERELSFECVRPEGPNDVPLGVGEVPLILELGRRWHRKEGARGGQSNKRCPDC